MLTESDVDGIVKGLRGGTNVYYQREDSQIEHFENADLILAVEGEGVPEPGVDQGDQYKPDLRQGCSHDTQYC